MTIEQIKKIKQFINELDTINNDKDFQSKLLEIKGYLGNLYSANLYADNALAAFNGYEEEDMKNDKLSLKSSLEGLLEKDLNYSQVKQILELADEGRKVGDNYRTQEAYIKKVYTAYVGFIDFPKDIANFCGGTRSSRLSVCKQFDNSTIDGLIIKLEQYASEIISKNSNKKSEPLISVVNNNSNNANINIDVEIKNAIKLVNDACWGEQQTNEVLEKIAEIEKLLTESNNKKAKWEKVKSILNWVITQGLQVATIVVPLIAKVL